jgi:hypothetical protein
MPKIWPPKVGGSLFWKKIQTSHTPNFNQFHHCKVDKCPTSMLSTKKIENLGLTMPFWNKVHFYSMG